MTRINLVEPSDLTDKHLLAEYRELPRIFTAVGKLIDQGVDINDIWDDIPKRYVLGTGHCKFFYNKLQWLSIRYSSLHMELVNRKFNLDDSIYQGVTSNYAKLIKPGWWQYWKPSPEEKYLNMYRLTVRQFKLPDRLDELQNIITQVNNS